MAVSKIGAMQQACSYPSKDPISKIRDYIAKTPKEKFNGYTLNKVIKDDSNGSTNYLV